MLAGRGPPLHRRAPTRHQRAAGTSTAIWRIFLGQTARGVRPHRRLKISAGAGAIRPTAWSRRAPSTIPGTRKPSRSRTSSPSLARASSPSSYSSLLCLRTTPGTLPCRGWIRSICLRCIEFILNSSHFLLFVFILKSKGHPLVKSKSKQNLAF